MSWKETKIAVICLLVGLMILSLPNFGLAQNYSSSSFTVTNPVIDSGDSSSASTNFGLGQSLSQIAIGKSSSADFQLWSGFQYFFQVTPNTLSATPGDAQVSLNWTVPPTFLGVSPGNYEVGTGTVSGSYVFQSVGNVTSFIKTGLTNGVPYFFIVKAETAAGEFLVFSNEATATPNGFVPQPPGGGSVYGTLNISGQAYPGAAITVLKDASIVGSTIAASDGTFKFGLSALPPGTYNFIVYATDPAGTKSANLNFQGTIEQTVATTVNNLVIAPTINTDQSIVKQGDTLQVSGFAAPSVPVVITLTGESQNSTFTTHSNSAGKFTYALDTTSLPLADYSLTAHYSMTGQASPESLPVTFSVGSRSVPRTPQVCGGRSDLNCDGRVNLIDFSILLYYWNGSAPISQNPRVDIDHSGVVDLTDFSIMLHDWTG